MRTHRTDKLADSLSERDQIWNGNLWNPQWFEDIEIAEIGCGEMLSLRRPLLVTEEHRLLLEAGADAISTNTLGAIASVMANDGNAGLVADVNFESARLARIICNEFSTREWPRWVLGSMGPTHHPISVLGGGDEVFERTLQDYFLQAQALWQGGVDLLHVEKCQDISNAQAALRSIRAVESEHGCRIPTMITASIEGTGTMLDGTTPQSFLKFAQEFDPLVVGLSGRLAPLTESLVTLSTTVETHCAVLVDVFSIGTEEGWVQSSDSLASAVSAIVLGNRVSIVGVATGVRADYVRALSAALGR
jgi:5-methyltetrahydrofolate--homocysteine methyltransferase